MAFGSWLPIRFSTFRIPLIYLENVASVASLLLKTEETIVERPEENKGMAGGMPHGHGGMDY